MHLGWVLLNHMRIATGVRIMRLPRENLHMLKMKEEGSGSQCRAERAAGRAASAPYQLSVTLRAR